MPLWMNVPQETRQASGMGYSRTLTNQKRKRKTYGRGKNFKRKVLDVFPAKHLSGNSGVTINNAEIYSMNLTAQIAQGTGLGQREGDTVHLEAVKLEGFFQSSTASNAYKFRLIVGYSGEEYGQVTLTSGVFGTSELFLPNTVATVVNGVINPKAFTMLYDEVIDMNSQIEGDRTLQSVRSTIKLNKTFSYQANASVYGKTQNLYVIVVSYAPDVAVGVANGSAVISYDLIFKD